MTAETEWAHAGRIAEAYETDRKVWDQSPTSQDATRLVICPVCGAGVGANCEDKTEKAYSVASGNDDSGDDLPKPYKATDLNSEKPRG